jgi:DMSO reductase anchor subunit
MVYVDTQRRLWSTRVVFGNFFGSTLALGAAIAAAVPGWAGQPSRTLLWAAILCNVVLFAWRQAEIRLALANPASRHHFGARVAREMLGTVQSGRTALCLISLGLLGMALADVAHRAALWAGLAAATILAAEFAGRYVFFVAAAGKRMPGGVAA